MPINRTGRIAPAKRTSPLRSEPILRFQPRVRSCATESDRSFFLLRFQLLSFGRRNVFDRCRLAELKRAYVSRDRPSIAYRDLIRIGRHRAKAVRHHIDEMADRHGTQFSAVE